MEFIISKHCKEQMQLRNISEAIVFKVLHAPEQIIKEDDSIMVYQSIIISKNNERHLFRIFVNVSKQPYLVITVYRTSKIDKYYENKI
jgi:hypothetical protein